MTAQIEKIQPNSDDCSICWDETAEPIPTSCGHTCCTECFQNKSSSASDGQLPMRCDGSGGDCQQVLTIQELKWNLSLSAFENLLASSFETHVRTHPNEFQLCPTFRCPQDLSPEATQSFKKWMKENKAQACPKCGTAIQKSYGCNHMQCFNCSIYFCWVCLHMSNSGTDCYAHIQREHTNYFRE
jgi:hypothetical protein